MDKLNIIQIDNTHSIYESGLNRSDLISGYIMDEIFEMNPNTLYTFNTQKFEEEFIALNYCEPDDDIFGQTHDLDSCFDFTKKYRNDKSCLYFGEALNDAPLYPFFDLMDTAFSHIDMHKTFVIVDQYYVPLKEWYRHLEELNRFYLGEISLFKGETSEELFHRIFNGKALQWFEVFYTLNKSEDFQLDQNIQKLDNSSGIYLSACSGDTKLPLKGKNLSLLIEDNLQQNTLKIYFDNDLSTFEDKMVEEFTILNIENKIGKSFISNELKPGVYELLKAVERNKIDHVVIVDESDLSDSPEDQATIIEYLALCKATVDILNI